MTATINSVNSGGALVSGDTNLALSVTDVRKDALSKTVTLGGQRLAVNSWGGVSVGETVTPPHIGPVYEGPTPTAFAPQTYIESSLVADGARYNYDSHFWRMRDNRILFVWWAGDLHTENDGRIYGRIINDNFETLVADFVVADDVLPYDTRNIGGGVTNDGRIVIFYSLYDYGGAGRLDTKVTYSDDEAATWSEPVSVVAALDVVGAGTYVPFGPMVSTSNGYMQVFYYHYSAYVLFSADGSSWSGAVEVYTDVNQNKFGEPFAVRIDADRIVLMVRCNDPDNAFSHISTSDGGSTWGSLSSPDGWTTATIEYGTPIAGIRVGSNIVFAWGGRRAEAGLYTNQEDAEAFFSNPTIAWDSARPNKTQLSTTSIDGNGSPVINFGYPNLLERTDGSVAVTWYDQHPSLTGNSVDVRIATMSVV